MSFILSIFLMNIKLPFKDESNIHMHVKWTRSKRFVRACILMQIWSKSDADTSMYVPYYNKWSAKIYSSNE